MFNYKELPPPIRQKLRQTLNRFNIVYGYKDKIAVIDDGHILELLDITKDSEHYATKQMRKYYGGLIK